MPRLDVPELMDQPWWPQVLRTYETDAIRTLVAVARVHGPLLDRVERLVRGLPSPAVVDLCAGRGGPTPWMARRLRERVPGLTVTLTDGYPSPGALDALRPADREGLRYHPDPVDPRAVPPELVGVRTLYAALHHFSDDDARAILADAVRARAPVLVVEATERSVRGVAMMLAFGPSLHLLWPAVRPRSFTRFLLTWPLPIAPLAFSWDATASALRTRTPAETLALAESATPPGAAWRWEVGVEPYLGARVSWLQGTPSPAAGS